MDSRLNRKAAKRPPDGLLRLLFFFTFSQKVMYPLIDIPSQFMVSVRNMHSHFLKKLVSGMVLSTLRNPSTFHSTILSSCDVRSCLHHCRISRRFLYSYGFVKFNFAISYFHILLATIFWLQCGSTDPVQEYLFQYFFKNAWQFTHKAIVGSVLKVNLIIYCDKSFIYIYYLPKRFCYNSNYSYQWAH